MPKPPRYWGSSLLSLGKNPSIISVEVTSCFICMDIQTGKSADCRCKCHPLAPSQT